jgi:hypothetical protein
MKFPLWIRVEDPRKSFNNRGKIQVMAVFVELDKKLQIGSPVSKYRFFYLRIHESPYFIPWG